MAKISDKKNEKYLFISIIMCIFAPKFRTINNNYKVNGK